MTDITPAKSSCCATPSGDACCAPEPSPFPWRQVLLTPWTLVVAVPLLVLAFDPTEAGQVTLFALKAFVGTLPYIVAAVLLIAWLKAAGAESTIGRVFEGRETQAIVLAALFGGLAPFCSCQVIPFIAGLLALGAPLPAIMAFWLSSPLIDPPTLLITAAALGWRVKEKERGSTRLSPRAAMAIHFFQVFHFCPSIFQLTGTSAFPGCRRSRQGARRARSVLASF